MARDRTTSQILDLDPGDIPWFPGHRTRGSGFAGTGPDKPGELRLPPLWERIPATSRTTGRAPAHRAEIEISR
jgi:hypothetical protein